MYASSANIPVFAIGLMSGTSLDGIDAALIRTDGHSITEMGAWIMTSYPAELREELRRLMQGEGDPLALEREVTEHHITAVEQLLKQAGIKAGEVKVIGFHGQTIQHRPQERVTQQLGDGALMAMRTGIDVICDFRRHDMAVGGQGAPLVPLFHQAITRKMALPVAIVNIGGVANVTWVGRVRDPESGLAKEHLLAFDTGPGNALLNDWMIENTGKELDQGGALALQGQVHQDIVNRYMQHAYFACTPPKSLDRNDFKLDYVKGLSPEDGAATLTDFTCESIAHSVQHMPQEPAMWLTCGGGRLNTTMMNGLKQRLGNVQTIESHGYDGDALEAQAFAYLAVRSLLGLPLTLPTTTAANHAVTGGAFYRAGMPAAPATPPDEW